NEGDNVMPVSQSRPIDVTAEHHDADLAPVGAGQLILLGKAQRRLKPRSFSCGVGAIPCGAFPISGGSCSIEPTGESTTGQRLDSLEHGSALIARQCGHVASFCDPVAIRCRTVSIVGHVHSIALTPEAVVGPDS